MAIVKKKKEKKLLQAAVNPHTGKAHTSKYLSVCLSSRTIPAPVFIRHYSWRALTQWYKI